MLKWRVLTAAILIPILLAGIFFLNATLFRWVTFAIIGWGFWEWAGFCDFQEIMPKRLAAPLYCGIGLVSTLILYHFSTVSVLNLSAALWLFAFIWLVAFQIGPDAKANEFDTLPLVFSAIAGVCVLAPFWIGLNFLRAIPVFGISLVLFSLLLVFAMDTGAYFAGRKFGKHQLASKISQGKTWEGVVGGLCASGLIGCVGAWYFWPTMKMRVAFVVLCICVGGASVIGDLLESLFKRYAGLKDSGSLLPGHGGLLDRLDSLSIAIPLFALGLMFMQWL